MTERTLVTRLEDIPDFSKESGPEVRAEVYRALGIPDPAKRRRR